MATRDFLQVEWSGEVEEQCQQIVRAAVAEDRSTGADLTTSALVPQDATGSAALVGRAPGVVAGLQCIPVIASNVDPNLHFELLQSDGQRLQRGTAVARISGPAASLLTAERILLNFVCRLSGIATQTRRFVDAIEGTSARIYDTRKTTPGWRWLEKYAVRQGGGYNHRLGLSESVLIKDNHLAVGAELSGTRRYSPREAIAIARSYIEQHVPAERSSHVLLEIEVDTLEQLEQVLPAKPDIVLLDNMRPEQLRSAVERRNALAPTVELEASGTINLETVTAIAQTGVDRISAGALTHGAVWLDFGLDWSI